ncbi:MAG TPA: heme ABC exporter ATP-binding protein CcmA [Rhizomicrobium sp.]|jgi:heme exporter protein A
MAASTCIEAVGALAELNVEGLSLVRGQRFVLGNLNFRVAAGEMLAVHGRNGAGKTSLLRALAGFLAPGSGTIVLRTADGLALSEGEERRLHVGWVGHQDGVKSLQTPREFLRGHAAYYRCSGDVEGALSLIGLSRLGDLPAQYLSAGQRRRLALGRLVLCRRLLWLLDEPLASLDRQGKDMVREWVKAHCAGGGIVVAATHEPFGAGGVMLELS